MEWNWVDYVIVAIIVVSVLASVMRGFIREALSLATWIVAAWVAIRWAGPLEGWLEPYISVPSVRIGVAFAALFLVVALLGALLNSLIGQVVDKSGLSGTDRVLGIAFGLARGVLLVAVLVLLADATPFPQDPWWKDSALIPQFAELAARIRELLPEDVASALADGNSGP